MATTMMRRALRCAAVAAVLVAVLPLAASASTTDRTLAPSTKFFVPPPDKGAVQQGFDLLRTRHFRDAFALGALVAQGHAVWFSSGTPFEVQREVRKTMMLAAFQHRVPVLVAYDVPFRDCGQYSSGGARNTAGYLAWIDGLARGIGNAKAVVILEPDGLGLIPGQGCTPSDADLDAAGLTLAQANQARYDQLNGAVDRLEQQPGTLVYLDGTHPDWLGVPDVSARLVQAGVERAQGFFLNASNYQYTQNAVQYGTWVSKCIASGACANKYWNGGPAGTMIADLLGPWTGVSLSPYGIWSDTATDPALNTSGINAQLTGAVGATHFVIDTSRNGQGPWQPTVSYPDKQDWCNPPGRGLGPRQTANTGNPLVDAYLWIKVPGESDGSCNRGIAGSTTDPEWGGIVDPAAGQWFPQQALVLIQQANPPLLP